MTRKATLLITGFTVALATAAYAATGDGFGPGKRGGMHGMGHHGMGHHGKAMGMGHHGMGGGMGLKSLDTDNDGDVTQAEFLKSSEARFAELDKDNAGFLDAAKLTAAFKGRSDEHLDRMMKRLDRSGDGKVSLAEYLDGGKHGRKGWGKGRHGHHGGMRMGAGPDGGMGGMGGMAQGEPGGPAVAGNEGAERGDRGQRRGWGGRHGRFAGGKGSTETRIEQFKAMDKNSDGFLDKAELQASVADDIAYRVKRAMHSLDANKDGRISKDEFLAPSKQRFARMDLNDDGKITADDLPPRMRTRWGAK